MASSRYEQLKRAGKLLEVEMDKADILLPDGPVAIGTKNLNSCSGLVILGESAIILAHIAPLPPHPQGASPQRIVRPDEGENHFRGILNDVQGLYNNHKSRFPSQATSWAIFGKFEGAVAMPEKLEIARQTFYSWGLPMKCALYNIEKASNRTNPAAGTVIGVMQDRKTYLYVEDKLQDSINFNQEAPTTSAASSSSNPLTVTPASGSTDQTYQRPQGFWAFSTQTVQFYYLTRENRPIPQAQWPPITGRQRVIIIETRKQAGYDFDAKQWVSLDGQ